MPSAAPPSTTGAGSGAVLKVASAVVVVPVALRATRR